MQIELFNVDEFADINHLQEVTSPVIFQRGNIPHPNGLISNEIFGVTIQSRKQTFAYIDLHGYFFHPHVYKAIKRMFRNIERIVNGEEYYSISKDDHTLVKDDTNGKTGIEFLYKNWEKITWKYSDTKGMRNERVDMITKLPKNQIFMRKLIVIPTFYRDIVSDENGAGETGELNNFYAKVIRMCSALKDRNMFDFQLYGTQYNIQEMLVSIYDYFKVKLEKKNGMIRRYLMGKTVDYATRTVITAPQYHSERPEDLMTDFSHCAIPISQICSLANPFIMHYLKGFFEREIFDNKYGKIIYDPVSDTLRGVEVLKNPESYFNDKFIERMIKQYIRDPESRFNKIEVPTEHGMMYLRFNGMRLNTANRSEIPGIAFRPMTWTDLLYQACIEVTKDKHALVTRYPLLDEYGTFITRIHVVSTTQTEVVKINDVVYKWYPKVDIDAPKSTIGNKFIDSIQFSNSYLPGIGGDYDGDQTTVKLIFSQEANNECETIMNKKSFYINSQGKNIRKVSSEATQTFYELTKEPPTSGRRTINVTDKKYFLSLKPEEITFSMMIGWFGNTINMEKDGKTGSRSEKKYLPTDKITLNHGEYFYEGQTTIGAFIFNKVLIEGCGLQNVTGYVNWVVTEKGLGKIESAVSDALFNDRIDINTMKKYIDTRDWFGFQMHSVVTSSFTRNSLVTPPEVKKLKKELLVQYKDRLDAKDPSAAEEIENKLIDKTVELLKDDPGMGLYMSGARGSLGNNYKNINLMRGAIYNAATGEYDIITNSFLEGLDKRDMAPHSNTIVAGAYAKSVATADSGYLAKELLAAMQTEVLQDDGTDCGTKRTIPIVITSENKSDFEYRYIVENGKLVYLDADTIKKYVGKRVNLRSPMYCTNPTCSVCAGKFFYSQGKKNWGLVTSRIATTLTGLNMKKFHQNLVRTKQIDPDDLLI